jgi:hypothetical protein
VNPREFCEERGYPYTLALTYSFDPAFFDRVPLRALRTGGSDEILVLADAGEVDRAMAAVQGPLHHLGRRYLLAPVRMSGAFHPKITLRLGPTGAIVALGSGNLTHGAFGGLNREVAAAWRVGPGLEDEGGWIPDLLERAAAWTDSPLVDRTLGHIRDLPWLTDVPGGRIVFSGPQALGTQLQARWEGRRFDRLRFVTGSTDDSGEVLRWLHRTFGVEEAIGCITPNRCAWVPESVSDLPLALSLVPHVSQLAHAKAYHLSGPSGDVLLIGSANCSPSAWLSPPGRGGNVEAMLLYEDPTPNDLAILDTLLVYRFQSV